MTRPEHMTAKRGLRLDQQAAPPPPPADVDASIYGSAGDVVVAALGRRSNG